MPQERLCSHLRHYAKQALTPRFLIVKLGPRRKGRPSLMIIALCLNSVLNVKAVVATFNQEKALVGAFSLLRDCTTSPINRFVVALVMAPSLDDDDDVKGGVMSSGQYLLPNFIFLHFQMTFGRFGRSACKVSNSLNVHNAKYDHHFSLD